MSGAASSQMRGQDSGPQRQDRGVLMGALGVVAHVGQASRLAGVDRLLARLLEVHRHPKPIHRLHLTQAPPACRWMAHQGPGSRKGSMGWASMVYPESTM